MLGKFWETIGENLGEKWLSALLQPALVFWTVGLFAWEESRAFGWDSLLKMIQGPNINPNLGESPVYNGLRQAVILALILAGVLTSSTVIQWLQGWLTRLLEGYWPWPLRLWRLKRAEKVASKLEIKRKRLAVLEEQIQTYRNKLEQQGALAGLPPTQVIYEALRAEERLEYTQLERIMQLYPRQAAALMPTALGNRLKAAEDYPRERYGLDSIIAWPRLWPLLSEEVRTAVSEAHKKLYATVCLLAWGVLTCIWGIWVWWAPLIGIGVALVAWFRALDAAEVYGDLLRAAFDLHRFDLYENLRWPLPEKSYPSEVTQGEQLTAFLFRGFTEKPVKFVHSKK